jgi:integrase
VLRAVGAAPGRIAQAGKLRLSAARGLCSASESTKRLGRGREPDLQVVVSIDYAFGWRTQSEVLPLERRHLDLTAGTIRLDPGMTKNDDGREVYLPADLKVHLAAQVERVRDLERRLGRVIPFLFPHLAGRLAGERRRDFRKAWLAACVKAGLAERVQLAPAKVRIKCTVSGTTSGGPRSGTWSMRVSRSGWR